MFKIVFYQDGNGNQLVRDYLFELKSKNNNDSNEIKQNTRLFKCINSHGTAAGISYLDHISGESLDFYEIICLKGDY